MALKLRELKSLAAGSVMVLATASYGAVYIVPPQISQYMQKTDQTFYDMYKNPNSALTQSVNPEMNSVANSFSTSQKIATGATVPQLLTANVQGTSVPNGSVANFTLGGYPFTVQYTYFGPQISVSSPLQAKGTLVQTPTLDQGMQCLAYCGGKYGTGCDSAVDHKYQYSFDASSGIATRVDYTYNGSASCGKYGAGPMNWSYGGTYITKAAVNALAAINNGQSDIDSYLQAQGGNQPTPPPVGRVDYHGHGKYG